MNRVVFAGIGMNVQVPGFVGYCTGFQHPDSII
jgi:hypothetical protein